MSNIIFIGDSLTQWFDWEGRFPGHRVMNLGISGETVEGLLARRAYIHALVDNPDLVFLMTGINNILNGQNDILLPYREIIRNLTTWYKQSKIVIQSILPVALTWISNNVIEDANRRLMELAREYNAEYLDVYSLFVDAKGNPIREYLSEDGVHLANNGYKTWADAVERHVNK
ncbi:MAG TPA: GDSL-type esterase/lipase family protein [Nitrospirota bacterium]|nr:GDSL-type esterase/lipase family protein [Nitrospirota bacterium]